MALATGAPEPTQGPSVTHMKDLPPETVLAGDEFTDKSLGIEGELPP